MPSQPVLQPLPTLGVGDRLAPATVRAFNNSAQSSNKIHDDAVARTYGFRGGLVPGVTMFAYMAAPLAAALGERWLTAGEASVTLIHPLYEGEEATAQAEVTAVERESERSRVVFETWVENPEGVRCAVGSAVVPLAPIDTPRLPEYVSEQRPPLPEHPPELTLETAPIGATLALLVIATSLQSAREYARLVSDLNPLFSEHSSWGPPLLHPGWLLSQCNAIFSRNFAFGPWIHTRSELRFLGPALAGHALQFHGQLTDAYERRGHHYAVLDVFCRDEDGAPVAQVRHSAIFRIRTGG